MKPQMEKMRLIQHLKQLLQSLLWIGKSKILENFNNVSYLLQCTEHSLVLPYRHSLQYTLIKLQRFAILESRVLQKVKQTALSCMSLLSVGNFFAKNILMLGFLGDVFRKTKKCLKIATKAHKGICCVYKKITRIDNNVISTINVPENLQLWLSKYELNNDSVEEPNDVMELKPL